MRTVVSTGLSSARTRKCLSVKSGRTDGLFSGRGYGTTWGTINVMQVHRRFARVPAFRKADRVDSMDVKTTAILNLEFAFPAAGSLANLFAGREGFSTVGDILYRKSTRLNS